MGISFFHIVRSQTKQTATEYIYTATELNMKECGRTISRTAWALKTGLMELTTTATTKMAKNKEKENCPSPMDLGMKASSTKMTFMASESTNGQTKDAMRAIGFVIKCTAKAKLLGEMEGNTTASTRKTRNMALEPLNGTFKFLNF